MWEVEAGAGLSHPLPRTEHHHCQVFGSLPFLPHCLGLAMSSEHLHTPFFEALAIR